MLSPINFLSGANLQKYRVYGFGHREYERVHPRVRLRALNTFYEFVVRQKCRPSTAHKTATRVLELRQVLGCLDYHTAFFDHQMVFSSPMHAMDYILVWHPYLSKRGSEEFDDAIRNLLKRDYPAPTLHVITGESWYNPGECRMFAVRAQKHEEREVHDTGQAEHVHR